METTVIIKSYTKIWNLFFIPIIILASCGNSTSRNIIDDKSIKDTIVSMRADCLPTDLNKESKEFHVKYFIENSFYNIELRIDTTKKKLNYQFNCETPRSIVPRYKDYKNGLICLKRGCSDNCIEFSVYKLVGSNIEEVGVYFNSLAIDLENAVCVMVSEENADEISIQDLNTKQLITKKLGGEKISQISKVIIKHKVVEILYLNNSTENIKLNW